MSQLELARKNYQDALSRLRSDPVNPLVKEDALKLGRHYAAVTRKGQGFAVTLFDEVALSNDIQAACAAATAQSAQTLSSRSIEQRLEVLDTLRKKGLISDAEYKSKRIEILNEI